MREMVRVLSKENEQLRLIVRELGACVGEGLSHLFQLWLSSLLTSINFWGYIGVGSALPRIGMTLQEYDALLDQ
jgi:hypothetical protein